VRAAPLLQMCLNYLVGSDGLLVCPHAAPFIRRSSLGISLDITAHETADTANPG